MTSTTTKFPGVALITGAGGTGIGAAVAVAFAQQGCTRIALTDINADTLASTEARVREAAAEAAAARPGQPQPAAGAGVEVVSRAGDVSDEAFAEAFVAEAAAALGGRVDYVVNCAGVLGAPGLRSHETPAAAFDRINAVNYRGSWLVARAALRRMVAQAVLPGGAHERAGQRGSVVHIASQLGIVGRPEAAAYCASKAAVIGMTKADAIDYSRDGIRVNCVCPGVIATPMTCGTEEQRRRMAPAAGIAPMRRMGAPEEVAGAVLFLCSTDASFVQGHALVVDGGYTIN